MAILKYASTEILGAQLYTSSRDAIPFQRTGHRASFTYEPRPGYLYVRSRMISSRCNDNWDEFPAEEIKKGYHTFIGKPVFVNHQNHDHQQMRGLILDAVLHEDRNPDGSPDTWVEGLMEIDALSYPKLAKAIVLGHIERTSMGVDVQHSICSKCGNKASTPLEYCAHVPGMKGKVFYRVTASGQKIGELIREKCYGLGFFENSLLVEPPADPTAYTLGNPVLGPGLEHLSGIARTAAYRPATRSRTPPQARQRPLRLVQGTRCHACGSLRTVALKGTHECLECLALWHPVVAAGPKYPNPADHPWFQTNPVSHLHVMKKWNAATPDEKASGMNWYSDAHILAKGIARPKKDSRGRTLRDENGDPIPNVHESAGILANYSPQQGWAGNMLNAARVLHEGHGIGGPGSGMFASRSQKDAADKILGGEDYHTVLKGPKIRSFAHLIEHGGDDDPSNPLTVIDRHALSVATGKRISVEDYNGFPTSQDHYYNHVTHAYHDAAQRISRKEGHPVAPHQVQAVTWLTQQRHNQQAEKKFQEQSPEENQNRLNKGRERARGNAEQAWEKFRQEKHPNLPSAGPGTGYTSSRRRLAYGEIKAPADVDTLQDDNCPICGQNNSYDGNECRVCGFVMPPSIFQDPDLDMAKRVDLRKQVGDDLGGVNADDLSDDLADRNKDGFDDQTGEPIDDDDSMGQGDIQPALVCSHCGTQFEAGEPMTVDTQDPQAGDMGSGPADGDVCPACGKGILETGTELAETDPQDVPGAEQEAEEDDVVPNGEDPEGDPDEDQGNLPTTNNHGRESDEDEEGPDGFPESDEDDEEEDKPPAKKGKNPFQ